MKPSIESGGELETRTLDWPIQFRFDNHDQVEVLGHDQDRFYTTVSDAARACRQADNLDQWYKQVKEFLSEINKWCKARDSIVDSCYVMWCDGHYNVIVVTRGDEYRFNFDDEITRLNLHLARLYPDIPVDAIQIPQGPEGTLDSFIVPEKAMQPYGEPSSTRGQSGL
jgi:hypothetical protein